MRLVGLLALSIALSGCVTNGFATFYTDQTGGADLAEMENVILTDAEPNVFLGSD